MSDFNETSISKNTQISNFMDILPLGAELLRAEKRTDRQTDMTKLIVPFRSFVNAPNKTGTALHRAAPSVAV